MTRIAIVASASSSGKTTLGRELARRLHAPFHELDALNYGPGWTQATPAELRARVEPILAGERWVVDGSYSSKLGTLVLEHADLVLWLDLPLRVWLPRLLRRTIRRIVRREELWGGNRETFRQAFASRDSLLLFALRSHRRIRRRNEERLASFSTVRLRSVAEVERWLDDYSSSAISEAARAAPSDSTGR